MTGKTPQQKGDRLERTTVKQLRVAEFDSKGVTLSGSAAGYPGEPHCTITRHFGRMT